MKKRWLVLSGLVVASNACSERVESRYDSLENADQADVVGNHKWIPAYLPPSTAGIREMHDLDTNEGWLRFEYAPADHAVLTEALQRASPNDFQGFLSRSPDVGWWDNRRLIERATTDSTAELYRRIDRQRNEAGRELVASRWILLLPSEGEGYIWLRADRVGSFPAADAESPSAAGWSQALIDSLRAAMPGLMTEYHVPGVAIALTFRDSVHWAAGFGVPDGAGSQVTPHTVFQAASLGKPVFAHLVVKLEAERDWSLAQPIGCWTPEGAVPSESVRLSAEALLSHTSGLRYDSETDRIVLDAGARGEWSYSGAGYVLLQRALEASEGRGLEEIARSELFVPWGLHATSFVTPEAGAVAIGHDRSGQPLPERRWSEPNAASSFHTSAMDYARFMIFAAGLGGSAPPSWARLTTRRATVREDLGLFWGAGWALEQNHDGSVAAFHWGSNPGFKSFALLHREREIGLVILTNGDHGLELAEEVVRILDDEPHPLFEFYMLHPDD